MSLTIPRLRRETAPKPHPKHRAPDRIRELEHQVAGLKDLARRQGIQLIEADRRTEQQDDGIRRTASQLGTSVVEAIEAQARTDAAEHRADEAERLRDEEHTELVALRARVANLDPWRIPQVGARDIDPDGQATHPIDVRALRAEHAEPWQSPVVHLSQAPFAAPTPADADPRSLSHRFMAGETRVTVNGGPFATTAA